MCRVEALTLGGASHLLPFTHYHTPQLWDTTKETVPKHKRQYQGCQYLSMIMEERWSKLTALLNLLAKGIKKSHPVVLAWPSLARRLQD